MIDLCSSGQARAKLYILAHADLLNILLHRLCLLLLTHSKAGLPSASIMHFKFKLLNFICILEF